MRTKSVAALALAFSALTATTSTTVSAAGHTRVFWRDSDKFCMISVGWGVEDFRAMTSAIQDRSGRRIASYTPTADGLMIFFKDGGKLFAWFKEIDCKDEPYDPFKKTK